MQVAGGDTLLGPFFVVWDGGLLQSGFGPPPPGPPGPEARALLHALEAYLEGGPWPRVAPRSFGEGFFAEVWRALFSTRPGEVLTYAELAARAGRPRAARAVGQAMAKNPWPFFVPCHRVIRADGRLGSYGPGAWRKAALLLLEAGEPNLKARLPRLRAHPDLAAVRLGDLLGDGEPEPLPPAGPLDVALE